MNHALVSLYQADKQERVNQSKVGTPEYQAMRARDLNRRERVLELVAANALHTAEDYYHAAWIMNHGDTPDEAKNAHVLALRSHELGYRPARWLAAASYDRWQMYQGKPQKYGTNYVYSSAISLLPDRLSFHLVVIEQPIDETPGVHIIVKRIICNTGVSDRRRSPVICPGRSSGCPKGRQIGYGSAQCAT